MISDYMFTPDWVHHSVFYQIFPDRFSSSKSIEKPGNLEPWDSPPTHTGFKGGDLLGVCEKLDYFQDLGINAIYLNPIFESSSNHRYHTHDYMKVDPLLGGDAAFLQLLREAHRRGIKIILDGVFNHASRGFYQFNHILESGSTSPYMDWFRIHKFPLHAYDGKPNYDCWWGLPALPEFNTNNQQVRQYIFQVARYWLDQGIDGWRLDVPSCIDDDSFWQEFRQVSRTSNPQAYLVGEIAEDATRWLQGDQFDGVMNYLLTYACWGFFGGKKLKLDLVGNWIQFASSRLKADAVDFSKNVDELLAHYPYPAVLAQLNLLNSHDTSRFLSMVSGDKEILKLAIFFLMTYPGAPCIYYGDEIGLEGEQDPDCRRSFPWDEGKWDHELRTFYKKCIWMRRAYPALRTGKYLSVYAKGEVIAYQRIQDAEKILIIINRSENTTRLDLELSSETFEDCILKNLLTPEVVYMKNGKLHDLAIPPKTGLIFGNQKNNGLDC